MAKVTKDMFIKEVLQVDRELAAILMNHGMHCVGCPSAAAETLEQAALGHGIDADALMEEMNLLLKTKGTYSE